MRILVVEDDIDLLNGYSEVFENAGHSTVRCGSFEEGRAALKANVFDAIVTDVRLGGRNGLGLLVDAEAIDPRVQKIVISGYDDPVLQRDAEALGATYLLKPLDPDTLVSALRGS
jgi:DNA-binding NtrC family response regulator